MSSLRSRQQKRRASRTPGVLDGVQKATERLSVGHSVRNETTINWRYVSGGIVFALAVVLVIFFATDLFYVRSVAVGGATYLDEGEVFRYADIAESHIFWIDAAQVREDIIASSEVIADAQVEIGWPPNMVRIVIEEREPQAIWEQGGVVALVDLRGTVLRYPSDGDPLPDLIRVVAEDVEGPPGADAPIPVGAITGALQMQQLGWQRELRYQPINGLGFTENIWEVWLGTGTNMPNKLAIYEALRDRLLSEGITPLEINVADPDGVYYRN
jgi:hypothetical protein